VTVLRPSSGEVLDALPDPIFGVDVARRIVEWNPAASAAYGYSRSEALGSSASELLLTSFPAPLAEILETLADTGAWSGTVVHTARDGRLVTVDSRWSAQRDERGAMIGALSVDRERAVAAERHVPELAAAPSEEDAHLGELATSIAHDFNNLLAVIVNYAALIVGELEVAHVATGEERWGTLCGDVAEIRIAAERAALLTRRLLAAARHEDSEGLHNSIGRALGARAQGSGRAEG
jgi:PAS domain S-box-containing protein